jgi:hypothetical protein
VDESFVPLATFVRGTSIAPPPRALDPLPSVANVVADFAHADLAQELALMRLAAIEAFERSTTRLLRALAEDVLARELAIAPVDVAALVTRVLARYTEHEPVEIVVCPRDAERVRVPLPLRVDAELVSGDLVVVVRDGAFESHFAFRLDAALERIAQRGGA